MEEVHSILSAGAGAVTKLVNLSSGPSKKTVIKRIFNPKYPYEYLDGHDGESGEKRRQHLIDEAVKFYSQY